MSATLYRKYRPQNFADLSGQNHIKITLQNEVAMGAVIHAYLFTGPRGTGKTTTARILAKAVNCEKRKDGESEPCNACEACISIMENRALDVIEIDAASHTGVDNVRENIIENVRFTPSRLKNKVFIIDEAHMLSSSAWNALLKTLEEPPARVIMILATTEVVKIPATIISRCQRFDFHRISVESLVERLAKLSEAEGVLIDKDVLHSIARHADGGLRDAESMLGQVFAIGNERITQEVASIVLPHSSFEAVLSFVDLLSRRASREALSEIGRMMEAGIEPRAFLDDFIEFTRKLLLSKFSGSLQDFAIGFDTAFADKIFGYAKSFEIADLLKLLERLVAAREASARAKIAQLPLEMAVVEFCESVNKPEVVFASTSKTPEPVSLQPKPDSPKIEKKEAEPLKIEETQKVDPAPEPPKELPQPQESIFASADCGEKQGTGAITIGKVTELWPELIKRVQVQNPSLRVALGVCRPAEINGGALRLGVPYKFHAERLNDIKNRLILDRVLSEFFGAPIRVEAFISQEAVAESGADPLIKKALEAFGGKVLE